MIFLKEKIYQNEILFVYDSSLCLGMGECLFRLLHFSMLLAVYLCPHSTLKTHPCFNCLPHLLRIQNCIYMQVYQIYHFRHFWNLHIVYKLTNVYKTFQGKTISGGDNKAWYLIRISKKIILIDCKDILVKGKRTGFKMSRSSMFEFESYSEIYFFFGFSFFFHLWVVWWVGSCFSHVAWDLNLFVLF